MNKSKIAVGVVVALVAFVAMAAGTLTRSTSLLTSALARQLLTKETALEWRADLGIGGGLATNVLWPIAGTNIFLKTNSDNTIEISSVGGSSGTQPVPEITSFVSSIPTAENGSSVSPVLTWVLAGAIISSQTIDNGIGTLGAAVRLYNLPSLTSSKTYTLTITDGITNVSASASVLFRDKRYWGVSSASSLTDVNIRNLFQELATSKSQSRTFDPVGQYIYFAWPTAFGGTVNDFTVNSLPNNDWVLVQRAFINANGYSTSYNIWRSGNLLWNHFIVSVQ